MFCHHPESWLKKELKRERYKAETDELKLKRLQILEQMLFLDRIDYTKEIIDDMYVRHFPESIEMAKKRIRIKEAMKQANDLIVATIRKQTLEKHAKKEANPPVI